MMTNGPAASIGEVLKVELERPRDRLILAEDPQFNNYRQAVLKFLYEKQKKPEQKPLDKVKPEPAMNNSDDLAAA